MKARVVVLLAWGIGVAAAYALKALSPTAVLYQSVLTEGTLMRVGAVTKLAFLLVSWRFAARNVGLLGDENPARRPWRLFSWGLFAFTLGQAILSTYQLALGTSPYPSPGDVFFISAYPLLMAAMLGFIRAYRDAGYPIGSSRSHMVLALVAGAIFSVVAYRLLRPILVTDEPLVTRALTAGYPVLDFTLLIPILLLIRITAGFRGGRVFRAWALVLVGIVSLCAGDILYAYLSMLGQLALDPLVDATYVAAYLCLAMGCIEQHELLR
jgi:hypothetical protein